MAIYISRHIERSSVEGDTYWHNSVSDIYCNERNYNMHKIIITVVGRDTVGIIAKVCTYLAEAGINVSDISQTIVDGYFNMMTIADMSRSSKELQVIQEELERLGEEIGVQIKCQKEEIFDMMHRI